MDLQEAFDAGFVAVKAYVDDALEGHQKALPDLIRAAVAEAVRAIPPARDGEPGKDAQPVDPQAVKAMVDEAVAALPMPHDGKDLTAEDAAPLIEAEVARAIAALPPAPAGKDADQALVTAEVIAGLKPLLVEQMAGLAIDDDKLREIVRVEVEAIPKPADGKSVTPEDVAPLIEEAVQRAVSRLPPAEPGKDAEPVTDDQIEAAVQRHIETNPIKTLTVEDLAPVVASQVASAVAEIPPAKDGSDAAQIASFVKDHTGALVVTMTDGRVIETGIRDGAKGDAGRDGLDLTGFDTSLSEDGRILTLSLENDEIKVTHELQLATMIYRGVFREGATYLQGDTATFGGSLWHCNAATTDKPDSGSPAWTLAAKRGRDGKDAKP